MNLPKDVKFIISNLNENGYTAYVVGGCVRDSIMEKTPKDWDITTNAFPKEVKSIFKKTIDTGIKHGTVTVILGSNPYEITTYRIDGKYLDSRRPEEVFFTNNLEEDLLRRDFTINAIAYHDETGFVDPFSGIKDIKKKIIKGVGDPDKRFKEDALRMMRAIRFSAQLSFNIEEETYIALKNNNFLIEKISVERIRDEFLKILLSDKPDKISLIIQTGIWGFIHKKTLKYMEDFSDKTYLYIFQSDKNIVTRITLLFLYLENKELYNFLRFLSLDNKTIKTICLYNSWATIDLESTHYRVLKYLNALGQKNLENIIYIRNIIAKIHHNDKEQELLMGISKLSKDIIKKNECFKISDLKINGDILQTLGIPKGKSIGETLSYLLDEVMVDSEKNNKTTLLKLAKKRLIKFK